MGSMECITITNKLLKVTWQVNSQKKRMHCKKGCCGFLNPVARESIHRRSYDDKMIINNNNKKFTTRTGSKKIESKRHDQFCRAMKIYQQKSTTNDFYSA